jgi:thiol:disulfide interchange protein
MKKPFISMGVLLAFGIGAFFVLSSSREQKITPPDVGDGGINREVKNIEGYSGNVLAGKSALFLEFNLADYEKAKKEGKIILLDFYANWCPVCRAEEPEIFKGFDSLTSDRVIGFRVNFKDSDTDADEQALARELSIPYQHTKVILKNGQEVSRFTNQWTEQDFLGAISSVPN